MDSYLLSVLVENHPGVLSRVSGLFSRRGFNIHSLAVGITNDPKVSRMTIVLNGDAHMVEQLTKQLNKQVDIITVKILKIEQSVSRELALIKVEVDKNTRTELLEISNIFRGKVIDVSQSTMTIELTGDDNKIAGFIEMIAQFKILEMVRTGEISLERGESVINHHT